MSKVKAVLDFAEAYDATNPDKEAEHAAIDCEVDLLIEQGEWEEYAIHGAVIAAIYADHVTAELQAENAALRAKVAELEKGREWLPIDENTPYEKQILTKWVGDERYPPVILINTRNSCIGIGRKDGFWHSKPNQTPTLWCNLPQGVTK